MFDWFFEIIAGVPDPYSKYLEYLPFLLGGFVITLFLTPIIGFIARKFNIYDYPASERRKKFNLNKYDDPHRHIHDKRVPFLGGLSFVLPFLIFAIATANNNPVIIAVSIGITIIVIAGILDDAFNLPAIIQLIAQILAAFVIASSIINLSVISIPLDGEISLELFKIEYLLLGLPQEFVFPGDVFLMLWIGVCMNAIKWVGGSDGLAEGNIIIALIFLFIIGVRTFSLDVSMYSIALAGAVLGYLVYNFPPAKIFTGCTGKTFYGFIIAVFAIINGAKFAATIIILALPLVDFVYVIIQRLIKYKPKNPLDVLKINDKSHFHHKLLELGLSKRQVLLVEASITLLVGAIAVLTAGTVKLFFLFFLGAVLLVGILVVNGMRRKPVNVRPPKGGQKPKEESPEGKYAY